MYGEFDLVKQRAPDGSDCTRKFFGAVSFHFCVIVLADLILLGQCSGWRRRNFIKPCSFLISDHACVCFRAASVGDSVPIQPSLSEQTRSGISRSFSSRVGIYRKIKSEFTCSSKTCPYSTQTAVSQ